MILNLLISVVVVLATDNGHCFNMPNTKIKSSVRVTVVHLRFTGNLTTHIKPIMSQIIKPIWKMDKINRCLVIIVGSLKLYTSQISHWILIWNLYLICALFQTVWILKAAMHWVKLSHSATDNVNSFRF